MTPEPHPDSCDRCGSIDESFNGIVIGTVNGEDVCATCRREELESETFLSEQEAMTMTLKEFGWTHTEIAEEFDPAKSTIDEYSRRANAKIDRAKSTLELLDQ